MTGTCHLSYQTPAGVVSPKEIFNTLGVILFSPKVFKRCWILQLVTGSLLASTSSLSALRLKLLCAPPLSPKGDAADSMLIHGYP